MGNEEMAQERTMTSAATASQKATETKEERMERLRKSTKRWMEKSMRSQQPSRKMMMRKQSLTSSSESQEFHPMSVMRSSLEHQR